MVQDIRNFTLKELEARFVKMGVERYRAAQVFKWVYAKGVEDFGRMTDLPAGMRGRIAEHFSLEEGVIEKAQEAPDGVVKLLLRLKDGAHIESAAIPLADHWTACLSTQVGCRFRCAFCASGSLGFVRNLSAAEIVTQMTALRRHAAGQAGRVSHAVFMGVGEPLDNYDNLLRAVRIMNDEKGLRLGMRKMTVSTCGLSDAIRRLAGEGLELELSVSLHAATDAKRAELLPVDRLYPLKTLIPAVKTYIEETGRKVTFEYVLLGSYNTSVEDARALVKLARGMNVKINLIAYNETRTRAAFEPPTKLEAFFFRDYLTRHGIDVTLRRPRGGAVAAACGQLRAQGM
ncbi:MAG: 23S rRNA (adenine(2503)-C(2))-methyltransferase RlmN [Deltaproteobacteria bacterium]